MNSTYNLTDSRKTGNKRDEEKPYKVGYKHPPLETRFKIGDKGGPGRGISIVTELKKKLEEIPDGQKKTYLELFVMKVLKKALQDEDTTMMKDIIDRVDGRPKQPIEHSANEESIERILDKLKGII